MFILLEQGNDSLTDQLIRVLFSYKYGIAIFNLNIFKCNSSRKYLPGLMHLVFLQTLKQAAQMATRLLDVEAAIKQRPMFLHF